MKRTNIMWIAVAAVASISCFVTGLAVGAKIGFSPSATALNANMAVEPSSPATNLNGTGTAPILMSLNGKVKEADSKKIVIAAVSVGAPNSEPKETDRTVIVSGKTVFVRQSMLSPEKYTAKLADHEKAAKSAGQPSPMPMPFEETPAAVSDIKAGSIITVYSAAGVGSSGDIAADKILIIDQAPAAPTVPAHAASASPTPARPPAADSKKP